METAGCGSHAWMRSLHNYSQVYYNTLQFFLTIDPQSALSVLLLVGYFNILASKMFLTLLALILYPHVDSSLVSLGLLVPLVPDEDC